LEVFVSILKTFRLAKFRFTVCARGQIRFPAYKGSAFRGGFGYTFKRVVCVIKGKTCDDCLLKQKCIYSYIFETPPPEDTEMLRLYPKVPHPFVIEPPVTQKQSFTPGELFTFHLILIGQTIDYLPYFIYTFTELGKQGIGQGRGKYDVLQVEGIGSDDEIVPVYSNKDQKLASHYPIIQPQQMNARLPKVFCEVTNPGNQGEDQFSPTFQEKQHSHPICRGENQSNPPYHSAGLTTNPEKTKGDVESALRGNNHNSKITISILTPLRLRFDGHITDKIEFHILIRNLLRRISSLSYFHCNEKWEVDFKGLIEKAKEVRQTATDITWFDWKRYSTRQEEWMSLGGVAGTVSYEGNITEFLPFLRLGEYVHVGKGTSFGLGKYEIL
jgi:CRISPR-associated endoribonuclease Cas6